MALLGSQLQQGGLTTFPNGSLVISSLQSGIAVAYKTCSNKLNNFKTLQSLGHIEFIKN